MADKREIIIQIALGRWGPLLLALALMVTAAGLGATAGPIQSPTTTSPSWITTTSGSFYLTNTAHDGIGALTACLDGYRMASLWELMDTSNLTYDTGRGMVGADSGSGPPSGVMGWMRTGYWLPDGVDSAGVGNCQAWTSNSPDDHGSLMYLTFGWSEPATAAGPWKSVGRVNSCDRTYRVWCVRTVLPVYLPLVAKGL